MKQKDIYLADLNPTKKNEQSGIRPVVIISGDTMNDNLGIVIVCPLTSSIKNYTGTVFVGKNQKNKLKSDSEILVFQIRAISQKRLIKKVGRITDIEFKTILNSLSEILFF